MLPGVRGPAMWKPHVRWQKVESNDSDSDSRSSSSRKMQTKTTCLELSLSADSTKEGAHLFQTPESIDVVLRNR